MQYFNQEAHLVGGNKIYSGNFDNKLVDGNGILAELLMENGIEVRVPEEMGEWV